MTHYHAPHEQRQIIRILYLVSTVTSVSPLAEKLRPATYIWNHIFPLIPFFPRVLLLRTGRNYLRGRNHLSFHVSARHPAILTLSYRCLPSLPSCRLLIVEFVATTASEDKVENAIARKDKKSLPPPLCCWRYRPTKAYFMYTIKWSVMQYVLLRPGVSIAGDCHKCFRALLREWGV